MKKQKTSKIGYLFTTLLGAAAGGLAVIGFTKAKPKIETGMEKMKEKSGKLSQRCKEMMEKYIGKSKRK